MYFVELLCYGMSLNDVYTSAQKIILRDEVCQNLSFENIFGENFCTENLVSVYRYFSIHVKIRVLWTYSAIKWI